jgi:hypothetical protein
VAPQLRDSIGFLSQAAYQFSGGAHLGSRSIVSCVELAGAVCALYAVAEVFKREGHREGYVDGYDAGFEGGFNRALGISDKDVREIHEKATEMKIDDISVAAFDKQKRDQ